MPSGCAPGGTRGQRPAGGPRENRRQSAHPRRWGRSAREGGGGGRAAAPLPGGLTQRRCVRLPAWSRRPAPGAPRPARPRPQRFPSRAAGHSALRLCRRHTSRALRCGTRAAASRGAPPSSGPCAVFQGAWLYFCLFVCVLFCAVLCICAEAGPGSDGGGTRRLRSAGARLPGDEQARLQGNDALVPGAPAIHGAWANDPRPVMERREMPDANLPHQLRVCSAEAGGGVGRRSCARVRAGRKRVRAGGRRGRGGGAPLTTTTGSLPRWMTNMGPYSCRGEGQGAGGGRDSRDGASPRAGAGWQHELACAHSW